jgi:hypothetical protein
MVGRHEVDRDRVGLPGHGERGRLAEGLDERFEVGTRDVPHVEPREHGVSELDESEAEPVTAAVPIELDEAGVEQRPELAGRGAGRHPGAARHFVRAEGAALREGVEHRHRALRGGYAPPGGLTGARHPRSIAHIRTLLRYME